MPGIIRTEENKSLLSSQSMGASFNSAALKIEDIEGHSIQATWSAGATPVGTLSLQASNSTLDDSNAIWDDIPESSSSVSGNSGHVMYNLYDHHYYMIRLVYTRTSGSATMNAVYNTRSRKS